MAAPSNKALQRASNSFGNVGGFIGGMAVVASLIYLAVQGRRNTAALRTASRQDIVSGIREHMFLHGVFALRESDVLEDETCEYHLQYFCAWVVTPGVAAWWAFRGLIAFSHSAPRLRQRRSGLAQLKL